MSLALGEVHMKRLLVWLVILVMIATVWCAISFVLGLSTIAAATGGGIIGCTWGFVGYDLVSRFVS